MSDSPASSLADRLARGEDSAFTELYDQCADRLYRYALARLRSHEAASDVVQTVFMRAVKSRRRFQTIETPIAYLFQIARNEVFRAGDRLRQRERSLDDQVQPGRVFDFDQNADAEAARAALMRLETTDRELVELKLYGGLTFREIAALSGQPQGTVATRYRRALESIRGWLEKQFR
jgi:RNA polymerase sigma-70 factor, ECF subfamily